MAENPNVLNREARKILKRWVAQDFYVYLRPMSAVYSGGTDPREVHWSVQVEYRGMSWEQVRGEGRDLSKTIIEMSGRVPNRKGIGKPGYVPGKDTGWLAAKLAADQQLKDMKRARKKKAAEEKPKKKSKKKNRKKDPK